MASSRVKAPSNLFPRETHQGETRHNGFITTNTIADKMGALAEKQVPANSFTFTITVLKTQCKEMKYE
jgi:hypothetical protein